MTWLQSLWFLFGVFFTLRISSLFLSARGINSLGLIPITKIFNASAFAGIGAQTAHGDPAELGLEGLGFGTMAPGATQGAALQKGCGSDAGAVLNGKTLNVIKSAGQIFIAHQFFTFCVSISFSQGDLFAL